MNAAYLNRQIDGPGAGTGYPVVGGKTLESSIRHLMAMGDHMLRDIGVTRADIGGAVRYGRD